MSFAFQDLWAERRDPNAEPLPPVFLIGLTGPIACGKSTVGTMLGRLGGRIVDADMVSRAILAPGQPGLDMVFAKFGRTYMMNDGTLNRSALARLVFHEPEQLKELEKITHPLIKMRIDQALEIAAEEGCPFAILEAIKLIESPELRDRCDEIWAVDCRMDLQRERAVSRGMGGPDLQERLEIQEGIREVARAKADRIIDNNGSLDELLATVEEYLAEALKDHLDILPLLKRPLRRQST
ncbi:MAG: dephospho-CoA kinase [Chloroflexota bacterium]